MLRRMNTWWGRSTVCFSADQFAGNLLESSGADVKRSGLEGRNGISMWKWTWNIWTAYGFHVETKDQQLQQQQKQQQHRNLRHNLTVMYPKCDDKEYTQKALRIRAFWSEIGRTPGCLACETPGLEKSQNMSRCLGREPSNSIGGGGETWSCC